MYNNIQPVTVGLRPEMEACNIYTYYYSIPEKSNPQRFFSLQKNASAQPKKAGNPGFCAMENGGQVTQPRPTMAKSPRLCGKNQVGSPAPQGFEMA